MRRLAREFCRVFPALANAIIDGKYLLFKYYYNRPPQPGNPNIIESVYSSWPVISSIGATINLRIIAELLRDEVELEYIVHGKYHYIYLPHAAVTDRNWPLLCLLLYTRGLTPFETILNCENKTAMTIWREQGPHEEKPYTEGQNFMRTVDQYKALIETGAELESQRRYFEAFKKYDQAASMVLGFHQGDANLVPFYKEEAIDPFYKAVQALIQDFTQPVAAISRLLTSANIQAAKRTHLVFYVSGVLAKLGPPTGLDISNNKDKLVDPARLTRFTEVIRTWQLPQTFVDWGDPALNDYNPYRPRSDSHESRDSAIGSSREKLPK